MKNLLLFILSFLPPLAVIGQSVHVEPAAVVLKEFPNVRDFTMSAQGKEAYITLQSLQGEISVLAKMTRTGDGNWNEPQIVPFSGKYKDLEPYLSPDNLRLWFASNRPLNHSTGEPKDFDIWYCNRKTTDSEWSEPINAGTVVNSDFNEFYPAVASNGNLYYTCDRTETHGQDDIFLSEWVNQTYQPPVPLSDSINTPGYEFNACIAPDESYLIYSGFNRPDGYGSADLYISYRNADGSWGRSVNLGEPVNSPSIDYCPYVDVNTGTLYFTSRRSNLGNQPVKSTGNLKELLNLYENGMSRIYKAENLLPKLKESKN